MIFSLEEKSDYYLFDPYHFGKILGESETLNYSWKEPKGIFTDEQSTWEDSMPKLL